MLKKAAWLALKIEAGLFSILVAATILTNVFFNPGPHSDSLILVYVPLAFQFAGVAAGFWLLPGDVHVVLAAPVVFLVQYLTYTAIVFLILLWRANP
jgi:hypothetical protein